jgi:hypothetical protein
VTLTVLIIGGYGVFGGRLVELLRDEADLTVIVAGRSRTKAERFCLALGETKAHLVPAAFDRNGDVAAQLTALRPNLLVDASGPYQAYGERPYRVIEACLAQGVNYLDLADGSDFVAGVRTFDEAARAAGLFVLSGASTCPALTAAAVRRLSKDMARIDAIRGGIAPSPHARVGENVIRAIAGYAGQPVALRRNGAPATGHAFAEQMRFTIAAPGHLPLADVLFSLVDTPDLRELPLLWPQVKTVWMGAGPRPELLHRVLIALAALVRMKLMPGLSFLAPLMVAATNRLRWGAHRGGMFVEVEGADTAGQAARRSWNLIAEGDDGPYIPSMAIAALIEGLLAGRSPAPGARSAATDIELEDYETQFSRRAIYTAVRDEA